MTMQLAALGDHLRRLGCDVDLDAAARRYREAGGRDDPESLLAFLLAEALIDASTYALLASGPTIALSPRAPVRDDAPTIVVPRHDDPHAPGVDPPRAGGGPARFRYIVVGEAGKGGMGTVHVARDVELLRRVALKELAPNAADQPAARSRFLREVQVTAQLDHPNIVPVYSLEVAEQGRPAYAMKLVEGKTFGALVAETRAFYERHEQPDEAHALAMRLEHFLKVCDAVDYAHARGVIHRDLKPANFMLGRHNEVYVMDWGICRLIGTRDDSAGTPAGVEAPGAEDGATEVGTVVGTLRYMSPEQAQGRTTDLDARSDQCALGLILYELVTLRPPYKGATLMEVLRKASEADRPPVTHAYDRAPVARELVAIVDRATALDPARRYESVRAFADDLRRFLRGEAVHARPDSLWQTALRRLARHRQAVAMTVLGLVAAALATILVLVWRQERALEALQLRERRIQELVNGVARQGDRLQTELLELQGELDALAAAASVALERDGGGGAPFLSAGAVPWIGEAPAAATAMGGFLAPVGVDRLSLAPMARRLLAVQPQQRELVARAARALGLDLTGGVTAPDQSRVLELRVGLESGLVFRYPARARLTPQPDPRQEAWYREVGGQSGPQWGSPFVENGDDEAVVPLSAPIRDANGRQLGAVSLLLSLEWVLDRLVASEPVEGVRETHLLDREGRVLDVHGSAGPAADGQLLLRPFPVPALHEALRAADAGQMTTTAFGGADIIAFDQIHPLDWALVVIASESALFK